MERPEAMALDTMFKTTTQRPSKPSYSYQEENEEKVWLWIDDQETPMLKDNSCKRLIMMIDLFLRIPISHNFTI